MNKCFLMFLSSIILLGCSTSKEKQRGEMGQKIEPVNLVTVKSENLSVDSNKVNLIKLEKYSPTISKKKLKYTFGRVINKSKTSGCSFVILTNDSLVFEPFNLEDKFKIDSLEIIFKYRKSRAMTTCMMGQTIIISEIKPFKQ